jgi:hypothetical protein
MRIISLLPEEVRQSVMMGINRQLLISGSLIPASASTAGSAVGFAPHVKDVMADGLRLARLPQLQFHPVP